jgi:hypothetical protein
MMEAVELARGSGGSIIPMLGPTRVGKTELLTDLAERLRSESRGPGNLLPTPDFVVGTIRPKPNDLELYRTMLAAVGLNAARNEKTSSVRDRLIQAIRRYGTKIIALDECSHCAERGANLSSRAATDHFKTVVDETGVSIILVGLPKFQSLIDENEQFRERALSTIRFLPYRWSIGEDREDFVAACFAVFAQIGDNGVSIEFDELPMVRRLYGVSGGRIGLVVRLMRGATQRAQQNRLSQDDIQSAAHLLMQHAARPDLYFADEEPTDTQLARAFAAVMKDADLPIEALTQAEAGALLDPT